MPDQLQQEPVGRRRLVGSGWQIDELLKIRSAEIGNATDTVDRDRGERP